MRKTQQKRLNGFRLSLRNKPLLHIIGRSGLLMSFGIVEVSDTVTAATAVTSAATTTTVATATAAAGTLWAVALGLVGEFYARVIDPYIGVGAG